MPVNLWGDEPRSYRLSAGVYARRGERFAFLERAKGAMVGFWSIPGGMVDPGEDPLTAAVRELHEESGLRPTGPIEYVGAFPLEAYNAHILRFAYVAECEEDEITLSDEHSASAWLTPEDYRDRHLNDAELARWSEISPADGHNVLANRAGIEALINRISSTAS